MRKFKKSTLFLIIGSLLISCTEKKCDTKLEPFSNTLNIVIDSIFQNTEVGKLKCVDNQIHTKGNLLFYKGITEVFSGDTLSVLNKVLDNLSITNPSSIAKVKPKNVILSLNRDIETKGSIEVSNYYYDKEKKLGAYFFILMLGQKGMKDFVVFYTIDDDCQVKLLSYKEIFSIPKNPIWVKKIK